MRVSNVAIVGAALFAASTLAAAADHPIGGVELGARRSKSGIERLVFSTKDDLLLPTPGSPDDPTSGSPGGITIELFSLGATQIVTFSAPRNASDPGWKRVKRGYQFKHKAAPDPVSAFASIRLHETGEFASSESAPGSRSAATNIAWASASRWAGADSARCSSPGQ